MAFIAAPVATWLTGLGASAAVAAVGASVAVGVVSGAVIGAASAAMSGENIFKGALKGAVIGGISAGVMSGLGMATGLVTAESQLAAFGVEGYGTASLGSPSLQTGGMTGSVLPGADKAALAGLGPGITPPVASSVASTVAPASGPLLSDSTTKILASVGEGAFKGLGESEAAKTEVEGKKDLAEFAAQQEILKKGSNVAGEFQAKVANIQIPDWWNKTLSQNKGILAQGTA